MNTCENCGGKHDTYDCPKLRKRRNAKRYPHRCPDCDAGYDNTADLVQHVAVWCPLRDPSSPALICPTTGKACPADVCRDYPACFLNDELLDTEWTCQKGIPGCKCGSGFTYLEMCRDCRDGRRHGDNRSRCVCPLPLSDHVAIPHVCEWTHDDKHMTPLLIGNADGICVDVDWCEGCGQQRITTVAGARKILAVVIVGTGGQVAGAHMSLELRKHETGTPPAHCGCPLEGHHQDCPILRR